MGKALFKEHLQEKGDLHLPVQGNHFFNGQETHISGPTVGKQGHRL